MKNGMTGIHVRREKVQRHGHRVIDRKICVMADIVAGVDGGGADMGGQPGSDGTT